MYAYFMPHPATRVNTLYESTIRGLTVYAVGKGAINLGQGSPRTLRCSQQSLG
jgi:hypothetical protein